MAYKTDEIKILPLTEEGGGERYILYGLKEYSNSLIVFYTLAPPYMTTAESTTS